MKKKANRDCIKNYNIFQNIFLIVWFLLKKLHICIVLLKIAVFKIASNNINEALF